MRPRGCLPLGLLLLMLQHHRALLGLILLARLLLMLDFALLERVKVAFDRVELHELVELDDAILVKVRGSEHALELLAVDAQTALQQRGLEHGHKLLELQAAVAVAVEA